MERPPEHRSQELRREARRARSEGRAARGGVCRRRRRVRHRLRVRGDRRSRVRGARRGTRAHGSDRAREDVTLTTMYTTLVVPLDGSEFSARALPVAAAIGEATGAEVRVVGVARSDAELAWTYDHVRDAAMHGEGVARERDVIIDSDP